MATYKFKVTFEDYDDVIREIEIKSTQTFDDLHFAIHNAIGFDASKSATFYYSDDVWKKGKEIGTNDSASDDNGKMLLKNARLCDYISDPHQKLFYFFDPTTPWVFHIELVKINREEDPTASYPRCIKSLGEAPKQYQSTNIATLPVPEDFDSMDEDFSDEDDSEETDELAIAVDELPEGEEKDTFTATDGDESVDDDFETADEDSLDEVDGSDKDDF